MKKAIKRIAMLFVVCGLAVSMSFAYDLSEYDLESVQYVKNKVEYLEGLVAKFGKGALGVSGESALEEGRLFLEFVEKVKQSKEKKCLYAVQNVMGDNNNKKRYQYYLWSNTSPVNFRCLTLMGFNDKLKEQEEYLDRQFGLRDAIIRQKANLMKSGNGALLKDGVTEVGTLSDGTKIEIEKK